MKSSFLGPELTYNSDANILVRSEAFGAGSHHGGGGGPTPAPVTEQAPKQPSRVQPDLGFFSSESRLE